MSSPQPVNPTAPPVPDTYNIQSVALDASQAVQAITVYSGWSQLNNVLIPDDAGNLRMFVGYVWDSTQTTNPTTQDPVGTINIYIEDVDTDHPFNNSYNMIGTVKLSDGRVVMVWNDFG